ncbi:MAG: dockerin type I repeat-containing protein [Phycisphaerae bacterium]|nr:dockerin type I repeat-containing protein [Phycisphaerae bacterium]
MHVRPIALHLLGIAAATSIALSARAEALYALSYEGTLYAMNLTNGSATPVRAPLASAYQTCDSVEYVDGWFYASYGGGKVVRFGFACGDEVDLGPSGLPWIESLAKRADGTIFAAVSQNNDVGAESIAILDPSTGDLSNVVASANQAVLSDMDAIAFAPSGVLYAINLSIPRALATINPATGAVGPAIPLSGAYAAMAWSARGTLYALDIKTGSCTTTTTLATIDPSTGAETTIGPTGLVCVAALTFGPTPDAPSADLNGDGAVDAADLAIVLGAWGPCGAGCCAADLDRSGNVDAADLGLLLGAWAP